MKLFSYLSGICVTLAFLLTTASAHALGTLYVLAIYDPTDPNQSATFEADANSISCHYQANAGLNVCFYNDRWNNGPHSWKGPNLYPYCLENSKSVLATIERSSIVSRFSVDYSKKPVSNRLADVYRLKNYDLFSNALTALKNCPATKDDALVVYWSGHGAMRRSNWNAPYEHYLCQSNGRYFSRKQLLDAAVAVGARFTVLFSDSCADYYSGADLNSGASLEDKCSLAEPCAPCLSIHKLLSPLLDELYFNYRGVLDVNACAAGEEGYSYYAQQYGLNRGLFSTSLTNSNPFVGSGEIMLADKSRSPSGSNNNQSVDPIPEPLLNEETIAPIDQDNRECDWDSFLTRSAKVTDGLFQTLRVQEALFSEQTMQTVWILQKPTQISDPKESKTPAFLRNASTARPGLPNLGDRILNVDGYSVRSKEGFEDAIEGSNDYVVITLAEAQTGRIYRFGTTLKPIQKDDSGKIIREDRLGLEVDDENGALVVSALQDGMRATEGIVAYDGDLTLDDWLCQPVDPSGLRWESGSFWHAEQGDVILEVNGERAYFVEEYWKMVKESPDEIVLKLLDSKSGRNYYFAATLLNKEAPTRFGMSASVWSDGLLHVDGNVPNSPATRGRVAWESKE